MLPIRYLPADERPRERCNHLGPRALSAVELMAIVLGAGAQGRSSLDVSQDVISVCQGSLREIATRPIPYLTAVRGMGPARAVTVHAALELGRRMTLEVGDDPRLMLSGRDAYGYYAPRLSDLPVEEFHVAVLDAQYRFKADVCVSRGTLNMTAVHPREVFRQAITENAYAVILAHNHPSGDPTPSPEDIRLTGQLVQAGTMLGILVLDHVVVGRGRFTSMLGQRLFL